MNKDLGEFSGGDDELGYQINGVVAIAAEFCGWWLIWPELAIELDEREWPCAADNVDA